MEDKLFVLTVHQLQGYSKGTPNISHCEAGWPRTHSTLARQFNYTSARDAQSLDGQYSHIATLFNMKAHPTMPSARDTQTLAGQPGQGHTVPCRPVLTANCHFAQHEGPPHYAFGQGQLKRQGHTNPCRNPCRPTQSGTHSPLLPPPPPRPGTRTGTHQPLQANAPTHLLPRPGTHSLLPKHPQPLRNVSFSDSSLKIQ